MQLDTTITLTRSELIELVRKAYPEIKDICEVKIVEDDVREWLNKRTEDESNEWIDVPKDWNKPFCPTKFDEHCLLDVKFKQDYQRCNVFSSQYWNAWIQEGSNWDIVKYRVSKQSN